MAIHECPECKLLHDTLGGAVAEDPAVAIARIEADARVAVAKLEHKSDLAFSEAIVESAEAQAEGEVEVAEAQAEVIGELIAAEGEAAAELGDDGGIEPIIVVADADAGAEAPAVDAPPLETSSAPSSGKSSRGWWP